MLNFFYSASQNQYVSRKKLMVFMLFLLFPTVHARSVTLLQLGLVGDITTGMIVENLSDTTSIILGTSNGVYIFSSDGELETFIQTRASVTSMAVIDDINDDGKKDIVIGTKDLYFPNVQAYDSRDGKKLWEFSTKTEVYDVHILWTMYQTPVFSMKTIEDVNNDGYDDIIISSGYGVFLLDSKQGKEMWRFEDSDNVWDIEIMNDMDGDKHKDVLLGDQNGRLILLSGATGKELWTLQLVHPYEVRNPSTNSVTGMVKRNVWDIVLDDDGTKAIVSGEDGYVYSVNLMSKAVEWKQRIIEYSDFLLYQYYGDYPLPTTSMDYNFFNLKLTLVPDVTGDGKEDIVVYSFPGRRFGREYKATKGVYLLDSSGGNIVWKNENIELSYTEDFLVMRLQTKDCLLLPAGKYGFQEKIKAIRLKDGSLHETITINSSSGVSGQYRLAKLTDKSFLMVSSSTDLIASDLSGNVRWNYPRLGDVTIKIGDLVGDDAQDLLVKSRDNGDTENPMDEGQSRILFVIDGRTKKIIWYYEMPFNEFSMTGGLHGVKLTPDLNGDGKSDIIAYVQYPGDWEWGDMFGNMSRIIVFSGKDGKILMNRSLVEEVYYGMYDEFYKNMEESVLKLVARDWGMDEQQVSKLPPDVKDEFYRQVEEKRREYEEKRKDVMIRKRLESMDIMKDITGDGVPEIILGAWKDVFIMDPVSGRLIWNRSYDAWVYENPYTGERPTYFEWNWTTHKDRNRFLVVGDINHDGIDDLALINWNVVTILQSVKNTHGFDYRKVYTLKLPEGIEKERAVTIDDMNGDGIRDIMIEKHIKDAPSKFEIISGKDGVLLLEFEKERGNPRLNVADLDGDGFDDSLVFYTWSETGPRLDVISGKNADVVWSYHGIDEPWMLKNFFGYERFMPAAPVDDMNGDGVDELAIVRSLPWEPGAELLVYDVKNDELLKTITLESMNEMRVGEIRWSPGISADPLPDLTGDGVRELGVILALGEIHQKEIKLMIIDVANGEIVNDFKVTGSKIININDDVGTVGKTGGLYFLDVGKDLKILSPEDGSRVTSPMRLEWQTKPESVKIIYVDDKKILKTMNDSATFELRKGKHKVTVYAFDAYGKGMYEGISVDVVKSSRISVILLITLTVLLFILLSPKLFDRIRR